MPYIRLPDGTFKKVNDGVPVDSTLKITGAAADAKAVGDALSATEKLVSEMADNVVTKDGGELNGALVTQANSNYSTRQVRNIIYVAEGEDIPAGSNGDICLVYVP